MISTLYFLPPEVRPLASALRARPSTYGSPSPKPPSGPLRGLTKPILITSAACAKAVEILPANAIPPAPAAAVLTKSRRDSPRGAAPDDGVLLLRLFDGMFVPPRSDLFGLLRHRRFVGGHRISNCHRRCLDFSPVRLVPQAFCTPCNGSSGNANGILPGSRRH